MIVYCFGSIPIVKLLKNTQLNTGDDDYQLAHKSSYNSPNSWFNGGMSGFLGVLPFTTWAYGGVECTSLITSISKNPKVDIPMGQITSVVSLFLTNMMLLIIISGMPGGLTATAGLNFPMNYGLNYIFHCTSYLSVILQIPAQFSMAFGNILPYGILLQSLSNSNLVPTMFGLKDSPNHIRAMILCSIVGYFCCLISFYSPKFSDSLANISILFGFVTYFSSLAGYYMIRTKYCELERSFRSPFGIAGAVYSGIVFLFGIVSVLGYADADRIAVSVFGAMIFTLTLYYQLYAKHVQILSKDEQKTVFKLHVINFNLRMHNAVHHKKVYDHSADNKSKSTKLTKLKRQFYGSTPKKLTMPSFMSPYMTPNDSKPNSPKMSRMPSRSSSISKLVKDNSLGNMRLALTNRAFSKRGLLNNQIVPTNYHNEIDDMRVLSLKEETDELATVRDAKTSNINIITESNLIYCKEHN